MRYILFVAISLTILALGVSIFIYKETNRILEDTSRILKMESNEDQDKKTIVSAYNCGGDWSYEF